MDELVYRISVETLHREKEPGLGLNEIGRIVIRVAEPVFLDTYEQNHMTGSFILVDHDLNLVMAAGMITHVHDTKGKEDLSQRKTKGLAVWLTGLSGAGKSTVSDSLKLALMKEGIMAVQIDGDIMRDGLSKDLGFSEADRDENIRRASEVAKIVADQGLVAICSFISPLKTQRALARKTVGDSFMEVHIAASLEDCATRDVKGLYARAKRGEIKEFTGISSPYEEPESPEVKLETGSEDISASTAQLLAEVLKRLDH